MNTTTQTEALRTIAEFPITDPKNMDAVNMRMIALAALAGKEVAASKCDRCDGLGHRMGDGCPYCGGSGRVCADPWPISGGRESVEDAMAVVESFGPSVEGVNDTFARQIVLANEVKRLRGLYEMAVQGRADMRNALRAERATGIHPTVQTMIADMNGEIEG